MIKWPTLRLLIVLSSAVLAPAQAFAQASIVGVVRDASGAVLPGVTIEASSAALIEKVRSVVSDGSGQYKIVDLRPGSYAVTFTLAGFNTVKREGIELTGSFAATVDVELKVGSLAETIVVSGESPIVDVQTSSQQRVATKEVLDTIPTGRTQFTTVSLIPGVSGTRDVGGANSLQLSSVSIHGGSTGDTRVLLDGLSTQNSELAGSSSNHMEDIGATQEVAITYAAGLAESAYGGLTINLVPQEGGNAYSGSFFVTGTNSSLQGSNLTADLVSRGLFAVNRIQSNYDVNPAFGGPIKRDKLWFFVGARFVANNNYVGGRFANVNAGDPNAWTYRADPANQETDNLSQQSGGGRVTWQATPRNKFGFYYDYQNRCWCNYSSTGLYSPEAMPRLTWPVNQFGTMKWSAPISSKLLLESRFGFRAETYSYPPVQPDGSPNPNLIQVTEQSTGIIYRSGGTGVLPFQTTGSKNWQVAMDASYVTGSHALKVGFSDLWIQRHSVVQGNAFDVTYRFNNGIPNLITEIAAPYAHDEIQKAELGIYAQDKWTLKKLTVNYGVRFDYYNSYFPEQALGPAVLVPNRNIVIPQTAGLAFKDITPRFGATYDLFGHGKTALKFTANKYVQAQGIATAVAGSPLSGEALNPVNSLANSVTRSWTPTGTSATNPNYYIPQCDLTNPALNGNCGAMSNSNFGNATPATTYPSAITTGWGNRSYQWEFSGGVQQELTSRMSVNFSYFRRIFGNFLVTNNTLVTPNDYSPYYITAPLDPRLPGGGGYQIPGLYDLNPNKVGQVHNVVVFASDFGNQIQHWSGIDATINARLGKGVLLQGGMSTGGTVTDNCDVVAKINNPSQLYCHQETPFYLPQIKLVGAYTIPKVDVTLSGVFQSIPGPLIAANYNAPNALIAPVLGRSLSGGAANATVNLVAPGAMYGERSNDLDLRFGKRLTFGRFRALASFDLYNIFNDNAVITQNNNYAAWQTPLSVLQPRVGKFSLQLDF